MTLVEDFRPAPTHFEGSLELIGTEAFSVSIAGIVVRFEGIPSYMFQQAIRQYQPFLSTESPLNVVRLTKGSDAYLVPERLLRLEQASYDEGEIMMSPEFAAFQPPESDRYLVDFRPRKCRLRTSMHGNVLTMDRSIAGHPT